MITAPTFGSIVQYRNLSLLRESTRPESPWGSVYQLLASVDKYEYSTLLPVDIREKMQIEHFSGGCANFINNRPISLVGL